MAEAPPAPSPLEPGYGVPRSPLRYGKLLVGALVGALSFGYVIVTGMQSATYVTPGELRA